MTFGYLAEDFLGSLFEYFKALRYYIDIDHNYSLDPLFYPLIFFEISFFCYKTDKEDFGLVLTSS